MAGGKGMSSGGKSSGGKTSVDGPKKQQSHSARAGLQVSCFESCSFHRSQGLVRLPPSTAQLSARRTVQRTAASNTHPAREHLAGTTAIRNFGLLQLHSPKYALSPITIASWPRHCWNKHQGSNIIGRSPLCVL